MTAPRPFLTAQWRYLLMLNYSVEPATLAPHVPPGTELDQWNGVTCFSLVGFLFLHTRLMGIPIPGHQNFEEVNLRFYVRRKTPEGWRRGVVFLKEIVPRRAIAAVARACYGEPYIALPMDHAVPAVNGVLKPGSLIRYGWRFNANPCALTATLAGKPQLPAQDSLEQFITEHYWGYTAAKHATREYRVEHPPWRVWQTTEAAFHGDPAPLYGQPFAEPLAAPLASAFVAEGSPVTVYTGQPLHPQI